MTSPGTVLTAGDPHPPVGTVVLDATGATWVNDGCYPACWVDPYLRHAEVETWAKVAGSYGPVTVTHWGDDEDDYDRRCRGVHGLAEPTTLGAE